MPLNLSCPILCGAAFAAIVVSSVATPRVTSAQPLPYTFTKITDTVATPGVNGVYCVGMNDLGTSSYTCRPISYSVGGMRRASFWSPMPPMACVRPSTITTKSPT